jgi:hypothetical protein
MRLFIAARSRFSEDTPAACVAHGVRQVVVLGTGLDTFSLRNPFAANGVRVFEGGYESLLSRVDVELLSPDSRLLLCSSERLAQKS